MKHFTAAGCTLAVLVVCMLAREAQAGETYTLGGLYGWTNKGNIDYNKEIGKIRVKIGDTVEFYNHDTTEHTFQVVDKLGYETCLSSGNKLETSITIATGLGIGYTFEKSGPFYCICSVPGHCVQGMKVFIEVLNSDGTVNTTATNTKSAAPAMPGFSWTSQLMIVVVATFSLMVAASTM